MTWTGEQLEAAIRRWEHKLVKDGRTPNTVATYVRDARAFVGFLTRKSGKPSATSVARGSRPRSAAVQRASVPVGQIPVPVELGRLHREWVQAGSSPQRGANWPRPRWIAAFPEHRSVLNRLPAPLDRDAVRTVARSAVDGPGRAQEAFVVSLTWGFGSVGYGPHRARKILTTTPRATESLHQVAITLAEEGPVAAYDRLSGDCRLKFFGPAFGTKYLAFCQPAGQPVVALIHDELVSSWLAKHGRPDLVSTGWSTGTYEAYLEQMHEWAANLGCGPETVEYMIFQATADERGNQWSR
jgi:hypothetical protein